MHLARALDRGWRADRAGPARTRRAGRGRPAHSAGSVIALSHESGVERTAIGPLRGDRGHSPLLTPRTSDYTAVDGADEQAAGGGNTAAWEAWVGQIVYGAAMSHVLFPDYYDKNVGPH